MISRPARNKRMIHLTTFVELTLGTLVALLPIVNPFYTAPIFLAITEGDSNEKRAEQARKGSFYMVCILVGCVIGGTFIIKFFGISLPGLRIAGGIMVAGIAMQMMRPQRESPQSREERAESVHKPDISFTPLAIPSLSGPGSIAATIGLTSLTASWLDRLAIILGIVIIGAITYAGLRVATRMVRYLGVTGLNALTKLMGFLLLCVGIQFVVNGVVGIVTDPGLLRSIQDGLHGEL
jgi:multiple antibiotic resistance protein